MAVMKAHDMAPVACEAMVASALKGIVSIIPHEATVEKRTGAYNLKKPGFQAR